MEFLSFFWDYIILFLVVLTILVFVHELGHYLVARRNGVLVEVFSIGFGPEIYGWNDKAGTRWKIGVFPLGGYVKMFGDSDTVEEDEEERPLTPEEQTVSFHHKRLGQRAAIVLAGPVFNFIFAIVVIAALFSTAGNPVTLSAVGEVQPGSAAAEAGLQVGDRIIAIDGEGITSFEDLRGIISVNPEVDLELLIVRDNSELTIRATPKRHVAGDNEAIGLLGVRPDLQQIGYERQNPLKASWMAVEWTASMVGRILSYLGQVIVGERGTDELGGPLRIAQMSGQMAQGGLINLISFMAALSINLGLINLFPIPMLDGGHLIFYAAEALRGRPLGPRAQEYGFRFGLVLVLLLMILATWNDLVQLRVFEYIKDLVT
jgi:regulator of sigma E protease